MSLCIILSDCLITLPFPTPNEGMRLSPTTHPLLTSSSPTPHASDYLTLPDSMYAMPSTLEGNIASQRSISPATQKLLRSFFGTLYLVCFASPLTLLITLSVLFLDVSEIVFPVGLGLNNSFNMAICYQNNIFVNIACMLG